MNNLTLIKKDGQHWVDSREVAKMVRKEHSHLCRDIEGYLSDMVGSQNPKLDFDSFFLKSSYKSGTGKSYTCYLISRKGCDFIGNKMTVEKGTLFTAAYVNTFHAIDEKMQMQTVKQVDIAAKKALSLSMTIQKYMGVKPGIAQAVSLHLISLRPFNPLFQIIQFTKSNMPVMLQSPNNNSRRNSLRLGKLQN